MKVYSPFANVSVRQKTTVSLALWARPQASIFICY